MKFKGKRFTPAMIVAMIALAVALTGTAAAGTTKLITSSNQIAERLDQAGRHEPVRHSGAEGQTGATGAQGPTGDNGAQGPMGRTVPSARRAIPVTPALPEQGRQGDTGATGAKGDKGDKGLWLPSTIGSEEEQGLRAPRGRSGRRAPPAPP